MHLCFRSSRPSGVYGLSGQLHPPGMQFQVARSLSRVALSAQFSAGTCRVQGGMRGRLRGTGEREFVCAAGTFVVRPCDVPAAMPGPESQWRGPPPVSHRQALPFADAGTVFVIRGRSLRRRLSSRDREGGGCTHVSQSKSRKHVTRQGAMHPCPGKLRPLGMSSWRWGD